MPDILNFIGGGVLRRSSSIIIVVVLIVSYIGSRYKVAGANEALIVSGQRDSRRTGETRSRSSAAAASSSCRSSTRSASSS